MKETKEGDHKMQRKRITLFLMSAITCCLLAGCGKTSVPTSDEIAEATSKTAESDTDTQKSEENAETAQENDTDYEACYAPVFDEVLGVVTDGYDFEKNYSYVSDGLMEKCMYPGDGDLSETVGYVLDDISGDGIPELIIGCDEDYSSLGAQSYIYSVFSLQNDKPLRVFDGWARSSYRWMGDDHFYYCGSGGASITLFGKNHLSKDGTEIIWDDFYFSDEKENGEIGLYHNTTGIFDAKESEELSIPDSEFYALMDTYEKACKLLSWIPIGKKERTSSPLVSKEEMTEKLIDKISSDAKVSREDVRYPLVDDLNADGKYEGFMLIGGETDPDFGSAEGEIWFVDEHESVKIHDNFSFIVYDDGNIFKIIEAADKIFVAFSDMYVTASVTNLYYMDGDTCRESAVSRIGGAGIDQNTGDLVITLSAYDCFCDFAAGSDTPEWTGHSWKPYYYYYSRNTGDFEEYGAREISAAEYRKITGLDISTFLESNGYSCGSIIQRDNGIINVNYSKTTDNDDGSRSIQYKNATYDTRTSDYINAWGDEQTGFFESDFGGIYHVQLSTAGTESAALPTSGPDVYGVFVMSSKDSEKCVETELKLEDAGFDDDIMLYTPDFSGLNPEPFYVVSAGLFESEDKAQSRLREVQATGFKDAYVKLAGKYIGTKYNYTLMDADVIEILKDCVILHDVPVSIPYWIEGSDSTTMDLYVFEDAKFAEDGDIDSFSNYEKGDTPYKWIVKNYNLLKSDQDAYMEQGPALSGVFNVAIEGNKITAYYGSYWWD